MSQLWGNSLICKPKKNERSPIILISNFVCIHKFNEFLYLSRFCWPKYYVIDVNLGNDDISIPLLMKRSSVFCSPFLVYLLQAVFSASLVTSPGYLLQLILYLFQLVYMIWKMLTFKTLRLGNIKFFFKIAIQKSCLYAHLI